MSGYHKVRVRGGDISKTAIKLKRRSVDSGNSYGILVYKINVLVTLMGVMNGVLRPFIRNPVIVFLDDILIFSKFRKENLRHLDDVLSTFECEQLYCKAGKCIFATDSVRFLGHIVTGATICPGPCKLQAVTNWPVPS